MITLEMRRTIHILAQKNHGTRAIARTLSIPRSTVRRILSGRPDAMPCLDRPSWLEEHAEKIGALIRSCRGNIVRVAEELAKIVEAPVGYSTLTRFCREHGLTPGSSSHTHAGEYSTGPGKEMQHDTSPIDLIVGGQERRYQAALLKFCFSRRRYLRFYRRWRRFECKDFLSRALVWMSGACEECIIDNASVVIIDGTGPDAIVATEMETLEKRFGFRFRAHKVGDANRSGKVERDFDFVQRNFVPGRTFVSDEDLNAQALAWSIKVNSRVVKTTRCSPDALFVQEQPHLRPLPIHVPAASLLHTRRVDVQGFICLDSNLYSAPPDRVGRWVTIRETTDHVVLLDGSHELATHPRLAAGARETSRLAGHAFRPRRHDRAPATQPEETWLRENSLLTRDYLEGLHRASRRRYAYQVRRLYALFHEYEPVQVEQAIAHASEYGLFDAKRLEAILLNEAGVSLFNFPANRATQPFRRRPAHEGWVTPPRAAAADATRTAASSTPPSDEPSAGTPATTVTDTAEESDA
jgi:transposase